MGGRSLTPLCQLSDGFGREMNTDVRPKGSPMLKIRPSAQRGLADHGWLKSRHTFSFAEYHDAEHRGFGTLRVINEDRIEGGSGFGAHPHRDMEIISYVVDGALAHRDSMGNQTVIRPGEVQRMSAGSGIVHAEMNHETDKVTHFFQIWIQPNQRGLAPSYGQKDFSAELARGGLVLVISKEGRDGSVAINQDVDLYVARLKANADLHLGLRPTRRAWIQVVKGGVSVQREQLQTGDGVAVWDEADIEVVGRDDSEIMVFDLPNVGFES